MNEQAYNSALQMIITYKFCTVNLYALLAKFFAHYNIDACEVTGTCVATELQQIRLQLLQLHSPTTESELNEKHKLLQNWSLVKVRMLPAKRHALCVADVLGNLHKSLDV
jgi:hypothetical protein